MKKHMTRITTVLLTLALLLAPLPVAAATLGDVDGNGRVNTTDARRTLQAAAEKITLDTAAQKVADINNDNTVNTTDARLILQFTVGNIPDLEQPQAPAQTKEQEVFALINQYRAENGASALTYRSDVQAAANLRAQELITLFSHTRPDGTSCFTALNAFGIAYRTAGENIAAGHPDAASVMTGWMNSEGHRANILNTSFTGVAIGIAEQDGYLYWVQLFVG